MKILESNLSHQPIKYLATNDHIMFLDIETTGLGHRHKIVLIGLVCIQKNKPTRVIQVFNDDYQSEKQMLIYLLDLIDQEQTDYFISYNGNAFDFPFINARLEYYHIRRRLNKKLNLDLLRVARRHKKSLGITQLNLKNIETHLMIKREDTISGKESITLYFEYVSSKAKALEYVILKHNYDDIINMIPLCNLLKYEGDNPFIKPIQVFNHHLQRWYISYVNIDGNQLNITLSTHELSTLEPLLFIDESFKLEKDQQDMMVAFNIKRLKGPQGELTLINPNAIYQKNFDLLDQVSKESLIVKVNDSWLVDNLISALIKFLQQYLKV
jgi:uncharacterized protein YprB with RNaseH-like and TPR domain